VRASFAILFLVCAVGCRSHEYTLPTIPTVTRVDITGNDTRVLKSISDPAAIAQLKAFVQEHRFGWTAPFAGTPVPRLHAYFYDGETQVGNFGVGPGFFETMYSLGLWLSRHASYDEQATFLRLIQMPDFDLNKI
jgi:hypothetical protein